MSKPTLLPSGLMDVLPPLAAAEFRLIHHFIKLFMRVGYAPVIAPMAEFEASLLEGQGAATAHHVFRVSDPLSGSMLALRADMTVQVARIATTTLAATPRPLRLCYAGSTLRTVADALKTRRQHTQVGIERFGDIAPSSVAEVLAIAAHALSRAGLGTLTIDLHYPSVFEALLAEQPAAMHARIREAVRMKDAAQLRTLGARFMADLIERTGHARDVLSFMTHASHPATQAATADLKAIVAALAHHQVNAVVTIDLLDLAGYGYYTGAGYSIYWNETGIEVGRGGCYRAASKEDAVGFTLYINELLDKLGGEQAATQVAVPIGTPIAALEALHNEGYITPYAQGDLKAQGFRKRWDGKQIKEV